MAKQGNGFSIRVKANEAEVLIYDAIDADYGIGAKAFRDELKAAGDVTQIKVRINSPGGNIFEGLAIYNTLKSHPAHKVVVIDGVALSMASAIAMAGDEIEIAENGFLMIHNPMNLAIGDADDMRSMADLLDKVKDQLANIYVARTKKDKESICQWMDAETWMTADEAVERGFADRSTATLAVAAAFDMSRFTNVPVNLRKESKMAELPKTDPTPAAPVAASYADVVVACPGADSDFICSQLKAAATIDQARNAWTVEMQKRLEAAKTEAATAKAAIAAAEAKAAEAEAKAKNAPAPGVAPLNSTGKPSESEGDADPIAAWNELVDKLAQSTGNRGKAISMAVRQQPAMHRAYLVAYNTQHNRPCNLHG